MKQETVDRMVTAGTKGSAHRRRPAPSGPTNTADEPIIRAAPCAPGTKPVRRRKPVETNPKATPVVQAAVRGGWTPQAEGLAVSTSFRGKGRNGIEHLRVYVLAVDRHIDIWISKGGKAARVYVDDVEIVQPATPAKMRDLSRSEPRKPKTSA